MTSSQATTVAAYLKELPADRRTDIATVRDVVNAHLPEGYVEEMGFGMIVWAIPLARYPDTYNKQPLGIAALAAQKNYSSLYLMGPYGDPAFKASFEAAWKKAGKVLDMGKSCVRFKTVDDLALDVVADAVGRITPAEYIARYEQERANGARQPTPKTPPKKAAKTKPTTKQRKPAKKAR
ncbi:MAG: DUF1801 domain-containing protein [Deltaproteobacteria bacterium]|nr:DUF1801 domain-containing protein [Deltaproteobacteria bacterium]